MHVNDWRTNWQSFASSICRMLNLGFSNLETTEQHANQRVRWRGTVATVFEDGDIGMKMPEVLVEINGLRTTLSYLALSIEPEWKSEWKGIVLNSEIIFETEIANESSDNPFKEAGIEWSEVGKDEGQFMISTHNSRLIELVSVASVE